MITAKISNLDHVDISITAGYGDDPAPSPGSRVDFSFVFGAGPEGLSPFEYEISGLMEEDEIPISIPHEKIRSWFGHAWGHVGQLLPQPEKNEKNLHMRIRINGIRPAEDKEIVRAMANAAACGCSHDDCCGSHSHKK